MSSWSLGVLLKHGLGDKALECAEAGYYPVDFNIEEACRELDSAYERERAKSQRLVEASKKMLKYEIDIQNGDGEGSIFSRISQNKDFESLRKALAEYEGEGEK